MIDSRFRTIITVALREAESRRVAAGYNGSHHDNGAGRIKEICNVWQAGLEGLVPEPLNEFAKQARIETDPEWVEYQRLRKKFEGK